MELLLNLAWLLLALPAYWLWRDARGVRAGRAFTSRQCLLALGCMLVILFPVVSATDDLRAMRTEIEESPASKRSVRHASHDKTSVWKWQIPQALAGATNSLLVSNEGWHPLPTPSLSVPAAPAIERASRAPPISIPR
jgi:hypothetical protein